MDRASAAGTRVKWLVPHRCQEAEPEPARRVGQCHCPPASIQVRSRTPRAAAPPSSPLLSGSAAVHLSSSRPHLGPPCLQKPQQVGKCKTGSVRKKFLESRAAMRCHCVNVTVACRTPSPSQGAASV